MAPMEGGKDTEIEFERKRSHSVPIISHTEKVLEDHFHFESASFGRETRMKNRRFSETCSPRNSTTSQKSPRKLSSGGLIRNQKRRHFKLAIIERIRASHCQKNLKPRASAAGTTSFPSRAVTHAYRWRERSKSLPSARENCEQDENNQREDVGGAASKQRKKLKAKAYNKMLLKRSLSLPTCLQNEPKLEHRDGEKSPVMLSTINTLSLASFESFVFHIDKLSFDSSEQSEGESQDILSVERRRSWPCCVKKNNQCMEYSVQNINFNIELREASLLHNAKKNRVQRSKSLPLKGFSCVDEAEAENASRDADVLRAGAEMKTMKDEISRAHNGCRHECGFRRGDALEEIIFTKEHSKQKKKTQPRLRSKSLPLPLDIEGEVNISRDLIVDEHPLRASLQGYGKVQDAVAKRTRRAKSLPCMHQSGFAEKEISCKALNFHHSYTDETSVNQREKVEETVEITEKVDGNIPQKVLLQRARSLPSKSLAEKQQQGGYDHQFKDDTETKSDGEHQDFSSKICRVRSKSLPNILDGEHSLNFSPVVIPELLEENNDIPDKVTTEKNISITVGEVESENNSYPNEGKQEENEKKETDAMSNTCDSSVDFLKQGCETTAFNMYQPNQSYPHKYLTRARGFSIPSSFKMEKIIEEPSDTENLQTQCSGCQDECDEQNVTDSACKAIKSVTENNTMSEKSPTENFIVSCNDSRVVSSHDEARGQQGGSQQVYDHENDLARFDKIVSQVLSNVNQLEFLKSSSGLHRAAANGDLESIKRLVEKGGDVNGVDESGWPVLHAAIITGNIDCGAWLVESGADLINYTNFVIDEYRMLSLQVYPSY